MEGLGCCEEAERKEAAARALYGAALRASEARLLARQRAHLAAWTNIRVAAAGCDCCDGCGECDDDGSGCGESTRQLQVREALQPRARITS